MIPKVLISDQISAWKDDGNQMKHLLHEIERKWYLQGFHAHLLAIFSVSISKSLGWKRNRKSCPGVAFPIYVLPRSRDKA